jgi:hypothetical protein
MSRAIRRKPTREEIEREAMKLSDVFAKAKSTAHECRDCWRSGWVAWLAVARHVLSKRSSA